MALLGTSGCATRVDLTWKMEPQSSWADQIRKLSQKSYLYAQMAANTYGKAGDSYGKDSKQFKLPKSIAVEHFGNDDIGFAYSVFRDYDGARLKEVIISFRGTEGLTNWDDLWYGNLWVKQNSRGMDLYHKIRAETDLIDKDIPVKLVGHSLGGAIAIHTAINTGDLEVYVFNTSPRFCVIDEVKTNNNINSIVENGEFLKVTRIPGIEPDQLYTSLDCIDKGSPFYQHSMAKLAECLSDISAIDLPSEAKVIWDE